MACNGKKVVRPMAMALANGFDINVLFVIVVFPR
jgi:hypothetical protein